MICHRPFGQCAGQGVSCARVGKHVARSDEHRSSRSRLRDNQCQAVRFDTRPHSVCASPEFSRFNHIHGTPIFGPALVSSLSLMPMRMPRAQREREREGVRLSHPQFAVERKSSATVAVACWPSANAICSGGRSSDHAGQSVAPQSNDRRHGWDKRNHDDSQDWSDHHDGANDPQCGSRDSHAAVPSSFTQGVSPCPFSRCVS